MPAGGRPRGTGGRRPGEENLRPQRVRVILLLLTIFGIPFVLMVSYLVMRGAALRPPFDAQPGGKLTGRVVLADGEPAVDMEVSVLLYARDRRPEPYARTRTASDGTFAFDVPPLDGCYVVATGGGTWIKEPRRVSLTAAEPPELRFTLHPGSELTLTLRHAGGAPIRGGKYELVREERSLGFQVPSVAIPGSFEGDSLTCDGLKPGRWKLRVDLDDGTQIGFELELDVGRVELVRVVP